MNRNKCLQESDKRIAEERRVYHLIDTIPLDKYIEVTIRFTFHTLGSNAWSNRYTTAVVKVDHLNRNSITFNFIAFRDSGAWVNPNDHRIHVKFRDIHSWQFFDLHDLPLYINGTKFPAYEALLKGEPDDDPSPTVQ